MIQLIQQYRIIEQIFGKEKVLSLPTGLKSKESILQNHVKKLKLFEHYKSENQIKKYMNSSTSVIIEKDPPHLERDLKRLIPWRKGPFQIGKHHIHAEWDCRLKWERLRPHLPHLKDKVILDIGCNDGLYSLEGIKAGAFKVVGFDINSERIDELKRNFDRTNEYSQSEIAEVDNLFLTCKEKDIEVLNYKWSSDVKN